MAKAQGKRRVILMVLDSVGCGALPDADKYGDKGSNTLANTARAVGGLDLPNFAKLGLGNIIPIDGVPPTAKPLASFGKMREVSAGKDTITGHWEMMGIVTERPFPTYPKGFPRAIVEPFERQIGRHVLGNKPASGTEIIAELGAEHMRTGYPIVYTSADSVFQIAAHEEVISYQELYHICETARRLLTGRHRVARVIARPFIGRPGQFTRTANRRDFSVHPPSPTVLDRLREAGHQVWATGKIGEIFAYQGVDVSEHGRGNMDCVDRTIGFMREETPSLIFTNLVDFDTLWGHRNNPQGFAQGLAQVDRRLPELMKAMAGEDLLMITADHGCDPTTPSTDHSREHVPLLSYSRSGHGVPLGLRKTLSDTGKTVAAYLGVEAPIPGTSFMKKLGL